MSPRLFLSSPGHHLPYSKVKLRDMLKFNSKQSRGNYTKIFDMSF